MKIKTSKCFKWKCENDAYRGVVYEQKDCRIHHCKVPHYVQWCRECDDVYTPWIDDKKRTIIHFSGCSFKIRGKYNEMPPLFV